MAKNILTLTSEEAIDFLMKSEQYHSFELPDYFNFDKVLRYVRNIIGNKKYEDCLTDNIPDNLDKVNLEILLNKDGKYGIRPLILANPYLYFFLVRELCCPENWNVIKKCFNAYNVPHIVSCALPLIPNKVEPFHKSTTILNWWKSMEQRSIELSLDYRYMFITDIANCYGSINPQSIEWALSCKDTMYENKTNKKLACNIQKYLRALQHGHNIGIPQGSVLFDLLGEIVLGYSDLLCYEALEKKGIDGYEIIRYRDDYRIFCNDRDTLERISYILQGVLETLNFQMNSQKTKISDSVVLDSIKSDKLWYIYNTPIFNKKGCDFDSFQKHLLYILMFSREYPNSGQLKNMLSDIDERIKDWLVSDDNIFTALSNDKTSDFKHLVGGSVLSMVAVATQIALENVTVSHYALRVISRMINSLQDIKVKRLIIDKVYNKLCKQANSDYNQLWLQNITYTQDKEVGISPYTLRLCKLVFGNDTEPLWNNNWIMQNLSSQLPTDTIIDEEILKVVTPVIVFRETRLYNEL